MFHQLGRQTRAKALGHQTFDDASDLHLRIALAIHEADRHAGFLVTRGIDDALHLAMDGEGFGTAGHE